MKSPTEWKVIKFHASKPPFLLVKSHIFWKIKIHGSKPPIRIYIYISPFLLIKSHIIIVYYISPFLLLKSHILWKIKAMFQTTNQMKPCPDTGPAASARLSPWRPLIPPVEANLLLVANRSHQHSENRWVGKPAESTKI